MPIKALHPTPQSQSAYAILCQLDDLFEKDDFLGACRLFNEIEDDDVLTIVLRSYPNLIKFDARGNYIGPVANENGWTP
jgi:hypothetical protein